MKSVADKQLANDGPEPFGLDLYVICAEIALEVYWEILNTLSAICQMLTVKVSRHLKCIEFEMKLMCTYDQCYI